ncbi:hypothetical protein N657DRAFT_649489 [Parathielavia appendiculata]|uniref:Copper acquisition factor BIM1-like domain-containing protein n=1 Tax=Parathielavia appendiculata TaxID=2587402 RepID=A0AAN6TSX4_9PEZI|nr:hypothetical protein N657DRAFT_649489 [Parathielavia appendiculata]
MYRAFCASLFAAQCLYFAALVQAHVFLTYPGWRGNNLGHNDDSPFGMQWMYPCGGLPVTTNRTYWPIDGGAVGMQPGWFTGHKTALMYINIGLGESPDNYSWPITKFHLQGPTDAPYPDTVCLPKLWLPEDVRSRIKSGDLATIQVVQAAKHGAGLFTCADIIFTDNDSKVPALDESNCSNSTGVRISDVAILGAGELPTACASLGLAATTAVAGTEATGSGGMWAWSCEENGRSQLFNVSGGNTTRCPSSSPSPSQSAGQQNGVQGVGARNGLMVAVPVAATLMVLLGAL